MCGYEYPKQSREIKAQQAGAQARSLDDLVALGRARGYKNRHSWASHVWGARVQRGEA
jgi:hypothetical protein